MFFVLLLAQTTGEELLTRGVALWQSKGDGVGALEMFDAVLRRNPEHVMALQNKAAIFHGQGRGEEALVTVDEALERCVNKTCGKSEVANALNTKGVVLKGLGRRNTAIRAFVSALALAKDHGHALVNLAATINDDKLAAHYYRRALAGNKTIDRVDTINELALVLDRLGEHSEAVEWLREAVELAPDSLQAVGNLAIYSRDAGDLESALAHARRGLEIGPESIPMMHNLALIEQKAGNLDRALTLWRSARTKSREFPQPVASLAHHEGFRGNVSGAVALYREALEIALEQNHPDADALRLQIATSVVPHIYDSKSHADDVWQRYIDGLTNLLDRDSLSIADPVHSTGSGALGYYLEYVGKDDLPPRRLLADVYWRASPDALNYVAPFLLANDEETKDKIKVGFLSAFVFTHSVGLLTRGVISRLDRQKFHVVLLSIADEAVTDDTTRAMLSAADEVITVPTTTLRHAQKAIAKTELDVLVFCEIGMHSLTYFLGFARLARRSVLFWGHAVTSGISNEHGIDYFVSSELFVEDRTDATLGQRDYSERLWLMSGLTTCFERPIPPATAVDDLNFPLYERLYVVPQTVYKLHPDFDEVIVGVLRDDSGAVIALPEAQHGDWTASLARRWDATISTDLRPRVVFVRRLAFDEFIKFVQDAAVVLDPFPVGGGRSSLEIFSVGTPIVMLEERTTILQLTRGMYQRMGDPCPECITHSISSFVSTAVHLAKDTERNDAVRRAILARNAILYENHDVVSEWQEFFIYITTHPRPSQGSRALVARELLSRNNRQGYVRRGDWGWEFVVTSSSEEIEDEHSVMKAAFKEMSYAVKLSHPDPRTGVTSSYVVGVTQDAIEAARGFAAYIDAEPVKFRWLAKVLQNGAHRSDAPVIARHALDNGAEIDVRLGDDIAQLAMWHGLRLGLPDDSIAALRMELARRTPEHTSTDWLRARFQRDRLTSLKTTEATRRYDSGVTIGLTTCKRLSHFRLTMQGLARVLPAMHSMVHRVIVVDDASSEDDRLAMAREWPDVDFFHKAPQFKGHAESMNILLRLVNTRYFLYLEDDWLALPGTQQSDILDDPLAVMEHAERIGEPLVQVLLNDQASRGCAYAVPDTCEGFIGRAGWPRQTLSSVPYRLHEFGTVHPDHQFTYWPGFTLNPALWDLVALSSTGLSFSTTDSRFEQSFSLASYDAGLNVAYLPRMSFAHIGVDESAYALQNISRPWEEKA